jgi:uncharacterized protein
MKSAINTGLVLTYILLLLITIGGLALINALNISYPVNVATHQTSGELAVVGEGKVDVVPDNATVEIGIIVNDATTVDQAQASLNESNNKVVEALVGAGIDKKDIKTSNYSVNPNYIYPEGGRSSISGYNGSVNLSVKVKDTQKLSQVIEVSTKAGANNIFGTNYSVENPEKYREEAREKAIANARAQANKLASTLGIRLGKVVNVVESTPNQSPIFYDKVGLSAERGGGAGSPDLQPGSQTITSVVTLYFEKR